MPLIGQDQKKKDSYNSPERRVATIVATTPKKGKSFLPAKAEKRETLDILDQELKDGDTQFAKDAELFLSYLGDDSDDIFDTLRGYDYNLYKGTMAAIEAKDWPQDVKDAYARVRTRFDNADTGSFNQWIDAAGDIGLNIVTDPTMILAALAAPFTGGASVAGRAAVGEAARQGVKRYGANRLASGMALGAAEGAVWTGVDDWNRQKVEEAVGLRDDVSVAQVLGMTAVGGLTGGLIGRLVDGRVAAKSAKLLDENAIQRESQTNFAEKSLAKTISRTIGKPSTYLDPIAKDSETAADLQKLFRYDQGRGWTNPVAPKLRDVAGEDYYKTYSRIGGGNLVKFKSLIEPISFNRSGRLTTGVNDELIKAIRTGVSEDETILGVAKQVRTLLDTMKEQQIALKLMQPNDINHYFPRSWNRDAIERNRRVMEQKLIQVGEAKDADEAMSIVNEMLDKKSQVASVAGYLFNAPRKFTKITDDTVFAEFLDNDVVEVMHNYVTQASKRMAAVETFGAKSLGEFREKWVNPILREIQDKGKNLNKSEREYFDNLYRYTTGDGLDYPDNAWGTFKDWSALGYQVSLLPLATISSLTEVVIPLTRVNTPTYMKGLSLGMSAGFKKITVDLLDYMKVKHGMSRPEVFKEMNKFMIAMDQGVADGIERLAGEGLRNKTAKKIQNAFFKANFLTQWTQMVQATAFISGKDLIQSNLRALSNAKNRSNRAMVRKTNELRDLGIDEAEGIEWIRKGAKKDDPYYEKLLQGAATFTNEIILPTSREAGTRPHIQTNPTFDIFTQFLGYPTAFSNIVAKGLAKSFVESPIRGGAKVVVAGAIMTEMARTTNYWRSDGRSEEGKTPAEARFEAMRRWGGNGQLLEMMTRAKEITEATGNPMVGTAAGFTGPLVGEVLTSAVYGKGGLQIIGPKLPQAAAAAVPGGPLMLRFSGAEMMDDYTSWLKEQDKKVFNAITGKKKPERLGRSKGGLVTIPNAPSDPGKRKDKMTGLTYDEQAGPAFLEGEDPLRKFLQLGGLVSKGVKAAVKAVSKDAPEVAAKTLDMSREARLARARELGFDPDKTYYHGTAHDFEEFSKERLGTLTSADSAKEGFFFSKSPKTSSQYADMAQSEKGIEIPPSPKEREELEEELKFLRQLVEEAAEAEDLEMSFRAGREIEEIQRRLNLEDLGDPSGVGPNVVPVNLKFSNPKIVEMNYSQYSDADRPRLGEEIRKAKKEGYDAVIFKNFSDVLMKDTESADTFILENIENYQLPKDFISDFRYEVENPEELKKSPLELLQSSYKFIRNGGGKLGGKIDVELRTKVRDLLEDADIASKDFTDQIVVFEPNQIRSVNAEFNPDFKDDPRLMKNKGGEVIAKAVGISKEDIEWANMVGARYPDEEQLDGRGDAARHIALGWLAANAKHPNTAKLLVQAREAIDFKGGKMDVDNNLLGFAMKAKTKEEAKEKILELVENKSATWIEPEESKKRRGYEDGGLVKTSKTCEALRKTI